jgi:levanbiose-producing levanase
LTRETYFTRRTTLGMVAALPFATACGLSSAGARTGAPAAGSAPSPPTADGRPRYHIAAPAGGWINDPQRPLKLGDTWTLWALYNPTFPKGGTNWRRWTSTDLVAWQDRGIAIPRNTTPFGDVWSGSTVVDTDDTAGFGAGALVTLVTMPAPKIGQSCALWYSTDGGASFAFHGIVLPNFPGNKDFRDPTVFWHAPTRRWVMTLSEEGKIGFYTSSDLKAWSYASGFVSTEVGRIMECSHLFNLHLYDANGAVVADKWILLVGGNGTKRGFTVGTYYWVGHFDGVTFTSTTDGQWLDGGADFYATVVWTDPAQSDPLASAYAMAWMSNWDYVKQMPVTRGYQGQLSLVRHLRLALVGTVPRLLSTPLAAQNAVFERTLIGSDQTITDVSSYAWPPEAGATACRLDFTLRRLGPTWPAAVSLSVRKDDRFATRLSFALRDDRIALLRSASGPDAPDVAAWREDRSVSCDFSGDRVVASVFVDSGSVEVFVNQGAATLSELITAPQDAVAFELVTIDGRVAVSDVIMRQIAK